MSTLAPLVVQKDIHAPEIEFLFRVKDNADNSSETTTFVMKKEAA